MATKEIMDKFDLEAANEGRAIKGLNELRPQNGKNKAKKAVKQHCMATA